MNAMTTGREIVSRLGGGLLGHDSSPERIEAFRSAMRAEGFGPAMRDISDASQAGQMRRVWEHADGRWTALGGNWAA